jgi:hypothetical protein
MATTLNALQSMAAANPASFRCSIRMVQHTGQRQPAAEACPTLAGHCLPTVCILRFVSKEA